MSISRIRFYADWFFISNWKALRNLGPWFEYLNKVFAKGFTQDWSWSQVVELHHELMCELGWAFFYSSLFWFIICSSSTRCWAVFDNLISSVFNFCLLPLDP